MYFFGCIFINILESSGIFFGHNARIVPSSYDEIFLKS